MDATFGTKLRLQREEQQIPLATIAEQTKIKLSLLEGLERDDVSRWPSGIFRRSYFRAYARAIGIEPDSMLREFQALFPDAEATENVTEVLAQARQLSGQPRRPPTRLRFLIDSAVSALPALHLQSSFRSASSGMKVERNLPSAGAPTALPLRDKVEKRHARIEEARSPIPVEERRPWVRAEHIQDEHAHDEPVPEGLVHEDRGAGAISPLPQASEEHSGVDFVEVAQLCTKLARALEVCDVTPVLGDAVRVLRAEGLILWMRDQMGCELVPVYAHGYSDEVTAYLGPVARDSDNAIAWAFRTAEARVVDRGEMATGAVVVPLLTPTGCAGALALELRHGGERLECVRAAATILAAQLSTLVSAPAMAEAVSA